MHINKLEIKGFGKFDDLSIDFSKGMNLIYGNNEAGKSTVQEFIKAMFYGLRGGRASSTGMPSPIKRFEPWQGNSYGGSMEYTIDSGERFRVIRNFNKDTVQIYDSSFNEITGTFDKSRGKGVLFADKQLGVSETCFEKTVFIKQMETRIGNDGLRELVDRLANVSQTGFEDVSFNRAQKALKEALKNYIGTEKTSVRPLDKINQRLEELRDRRELLVKKKEELLDTELEYYIAVESLKKMGEKKELLKKIKEVQELQSILDKEIKQECSLREIVQNVNGLKEQLSEIEAGIEELLTKERELADYSTFSQEDANELSILYYSYLKQMEEKTKTEQQLEEAEKQRAELESNITWRGIPTTLETDYSRAVELSREIKSLREEYEGLDVELLTEKVRAGHDRKRNKFMLTIASIVGFIIFVAIGFLGEPAVFGAAFAAFVASVWSAVSLLNASKSVDSLMSKKRLAFISSTALKDKLLSNQTELDNILKRAGVEDVEELLSTNTQYDREIFRLNSICEEITRLKSQLQSSLSDAEGKRKRIIDILMQVGTRLEGDSEIEKSHIEEFGSRLKEYGDIQKNLAFKRQRKIDLEKNLELQFKNAESVCGEKVSTGSMLEEELSKIKSRIEDRKVQLKHMEEGVSECSLEVRKESADNEYSTTEEEIARLQLKIAGLKTLLDSRAEEGSALQETEEEIAELEEKKAQLEDKHFSLKTALDILTEASAEIQKDFAPVLNQKMSAAIGRITGDRYADLRADSSLALKVLVPETGEVVNNIILSRGTVDQLYLALRVAMADIIACSQESLPFIMDEVFAQYDDYRVSNSFEFLRELSEQRQIIFFTCKSREVDIANQIFDKRLNVISI